MPLTGSGLSCTKPSLYLELAAKDRSPLPRTCWFLASKDGRDEFALGHDADPDRRGPYPLFDCGRLDPGIYRIRVDLDGFLPTTITTTIGTLPRRELVELDPGTSVTGFVRTDAGDPMVGVQVDAGDESTRTVDDGSYRLSGVEEGWIDVFASGDHLATLQRRTETRRDRAVEVDFVAPANGAIRLEFDWGDATARFQVSLESRNHFTTVSSEHWSEDWASDVRISMGTIHSLIARVRPGTYRLRGEWGGRAFAQRDIEVPGYVRALVCVPNPAERNAAPQ